MSTAFALVDCNNFYVSCQRVFNPSLNGQPVIVLSNNDGCVISRSAEAKQLGIAMGAPYFRIRKSAREHGVRVFSSNYALYADMSQRVMETLAELAPDVEVYSIDEAFLRMDNLYDNDGRPISDLNEYGRSIRRRVKQWTGIPVSVGIAPTKTLAKLANSIAKTSPRADGVLYLRQPFIDTALAKTPVSDVWGIGRKHTRLLAGHNITTAYELCHASDVMIRRHMGIPGLRILAELRGIPCYTLEPASATKKGITCSRSFGSPVSSLSDLKEAVALYVSRAAEKLRSQQSHTSFLTVFIHTNRFRSDLPQHSDSCHSVLPFPTNSTSVLLRYATEGLERMYREEYAYQKAGVMLTDLIPSASVPVSLFDATTPACAADTVSALVDSINHKMGGETVSFAAAGSRHQRPWSMRRDWRSPSYTTQWKDIPLLSEPRQPGTQKSTS